MREGWLARPDPAAPLDVFFELSEYVLRADLEVLYGRSFCDKCALPAVPRRPDVPPRAHADHRHQSLPPPAHAAW